MGVSHGIAVIILIMNENSIEANYKKNVESTMECLNSNNSNITQDCEKMKAFSSFFDCCGFNGKYIYIYIFIYIKHVRPTKKMSHMSTDFRLCIMLRACQENGEFSVF